MSKGHTSQDPFLNVLRKERIPVSIYLVSGIKLQGQIESFDQFVILLKNAVSQMVYKHAISTVVPARMVKVPDNRVLSARSLQQILETAKRARVAVAVPYESMLEMGATISLGTQAEDIAATIARVIRQIHAEGLKNVPEISPLSAIRVVTPGGTNLVKR